MGERKVLNKYIPPDFDPKLVPKTKWDPFKQIETRMMIPFNIQCETCGEFMGRGKKFTMKKEDVHGDDYKGVKKFRFYLKCTVCAREITFITDPENMDYAIEHGAKRLFEIWKDNAKTEAEEDKRRDDEEKADAMKALEHRTIDSKLEMDIMDALEETKAMSAKRDAIRPDMMIAMRHQEDMEQLGKLEEEDEQLVKQAFGRQGAGAVQKRLDDSDEEEGATNGGPPGPQGVKPPVKPLDAPKAVMKPKLNIKAKKRKAPDADSRATTATAQQQQPPAKLAKEGDAGGRGKGAVGGGGSESGAAGSRNGVSSQHVTVVNGNGASSSAAAPQSQPPQSQPGAKASESSAGGLGGLLGAYGSSDED